MEANGEWAKRDLAKRGVTVCVRGDSTYVTYKHFFSHLTTVLNECNSFDCLTLGSDDEQAMSRDFPKC